MRIASCLIALFVSCGLEARSAQDYLPADADLDPAIPPPATLLGWEVGDWHVSHDKLVAYMQALAAASRRERRAMCSLTRILLISSRWIWFVPS